MSKLIEPTYLACDPGINSCGLAIFTIQEKSITVKETHLVNNIRKFTEEEKVIEKKYTSRLVKVNSIFNKFKEIITSNKIDCIIVEAPFYNALTPVAYGSLLEVITIIKYNIAYANDLEFMLLEPLYIKKVFTNAAMAKKHVIKEFLIKKKADGSIILEKDIETMSEHEIDAVAIAFSYTCIMRNGGVK
ncbi:MAG: hypothetical protein ACD_33C00045G0002 [uncultured bacterium]|nr:MAG: hypothetical protein ACD_33C00045G0002 [uncultured bacterium]